MGSGRTVGARESPGPSLGVITFTRLAVVAVIGLALCSDTVVASPHRRTESARNIIPAAQPALVGSYPRAVHTSRARRHAATAARPVRVAARVTHRAVTRRARPHPVYASRVTGMAGVIAFALAQVGKPYVYRATGPDAWDCSGLIQGAFASVGIRFPHLARGIYRSTLVTRIPRSALRPGDIVWPTYGHIALYIGGGRIVHATNPRQGVRIDPVYSFAAGGRVTRTG